MSTGLLRGEPEPVHPGRAATNAIFGFSNILLKLLDEEKPDALAVTSTSRPPPSATRAYEGYKAQRKGMPDELAAQMPVLKQVLDAMNIRRYELEGWEADDLLGTMSLRAEEQGWTRWWSPGTRTPCSSLTSTSTVKLVSTRMGQTTTRDMTPAAFREQYGFDPIHMIDLKALMGDASDNIPGVKGIGEKTAMALMAPVPRREGTVRPPGHRGGQAGGAQAAGGGTGVCPNEL